MSARSDRRAVVATISFAIDGELGEQLVGKHPAVVQTGVSSGAIRQGTHLWSDDRIVQAYPSLFVDASIVPTAGQSADGAADPESAPAESAGADESDPDYGYANLTREDILTARAKYLATRPRSGSIHGRLNVSKSTLIRARHRLGLVPWPKD